MKGEQKDATAIDILSICPKARNNFAVRVR